MKIAILNSHSVAARRRAWLFRLFAISVLASASGASCRSIADQYTMASPRLLPEPATLDDVVRVVNENTYRVRSLHTADAQISVPMTPTLQATIALDRPQRFRLRAETSLTGAEVDLGSNDELFWFWVRRNQPRATYFCRHDQFAASPIRQIIPVEPQWLVEAFGLTWFDPQEQHEGPLPAGEGRLRVRTTRRNSLGQALTKITVLDSARGWILEQHLFDEQGQRIATALTSEHRRDLLHDVVLPRQLEIHWPAAQATMTIQVGAWDVNTLADDSRQLWVMPEYPGFPPVDLSRP
jgi:hypothetical protein